MPRRTFRVRIYLACKTKIPITLPTPYRLPSFPALQVDNCYPACRTHRTRRAVNPEKILRDFYSPDHLEELAGHASRSQVSRQQHRQKPKRTGTHLSCGKQNPVILAILQERLGIRQFMSGIFNHTLRSVMLERGERRPIDRRQCIL